VRIRLLKVQARKDKMVISNLANDDEALSSISSSTKRKRANVSAEALEINIDAPEPPSKKVLRRARKGKAVIAVKAREDSPGAGNVSGEETLAINAPLKRSEHGIWIGNLPWSATKTDVHSFITTNTDITDEAITRLHMPSPGEAVTGASRQKLKPQNKGFAYIDFASESALIQALALSETLLRGRRVLIKDSKSFEGRPEKLKEDDAGTAAKHSGKPPSRRIFVGNLAFDVSKEDLQDHFAPCGAVADVHMATFEDSGKCKGYAWVEFADLQAGEAAVRGWVLYDNNINVSSSEEDGDDGQNDDDVDTEDEDKSKKAKAERKSKTKKPPKPRKWWVNKLKGRVLRMEFAEDKTVRYKKRYGKDGSSRNQNSTSDGATALGEELDDPTSTTALITAIPKPAPDSAPTISSRSPASKPEPRPGQMARKPDARNIKPGAALAAAPRLTGGIIPSQGKKTSLA
jgi:RNA recognition motif-containing protein